MRGASSTFGGRGRSEKRDGSEEGEVGGGGVAVVEAGAGVVVVEVAVEVAVEGVSVVGGGGVFVRPVGVGTLDRFAGVAEGRGLFLDRSRDEGAERKSSGMSFHCSVVLGSGVVVPEGVRFTGIRGGAEADLGGGGGRFGGADEEGGGGGDWVFSLLAAGFFSHPDKEDCSIVVRSCAMWWSR